MYVTQLFWMRQAVEIGPIFQDWSNLIGGSLRTWSHRVAMFAMSVDPGGPVNSDCLRVLFVGIVADGHFVAALIARRRGWWGQGGNGCLRWCHCHSRRDRHSWRDGHSRRDGYGWGDGHRRCGGWRGSCRYRRHNNHDNDDDGCLTMLRAACDADCAADENTAVDGRHIVQVNSCPILQGNRAAGLGDDDGNGRYTSTKLQR